MNALTTIARSLKTKLVESGQACEADRTATLTKAASVARDRVAKLRGRVDAWVVGALFGAVSTSASAQNTTANFTAVQNFLQAFVNFMTGPFGKAAVVLSIIAAFVTWVFAPKDGIFGPVLRVVVAGIAIMNAALWITQLGGATQITL